MHIYISLYLFILLLIALFKSKQARMFGKNKELLFLRISFILFFFLMALREPHLGTDSWMYGNIYLRIGSADSLIKAFEQSTISAPLYVIVCRLLYFIFPVRQALIILSAIVVNYGFYAFIKKESNNYYVSTLLYLTFTFYFQSFNGTRQYIAIALILNAYSKWNENLKSKKAWILYVAAVLCHATAFIAIVYWFILLTSRKKTSEVKTLITILLIAAVSLIGVNYGLNLFLKLFPSYSGYLSNSIGHSFSDDYGQGRVIYIYFWFAIIVVYAFIILYHAEKQCEDRRIYGFLYLIVIATSLGIIGARAWAINRMISFFSCVIICFAPNILQLSKRYTRITKLLLYATLVISSIYCFYYLYEDKADIVPYLFFWQ